MNMMEIFQPIAWVFGYLLRFINSTIGFNNYLLTILWFTLVTRLLTFPFSLKNQKSSMDRARLAPRIERLQKKYARDPQKLQQKQQELYEKEGVSMTGGCLPMLLSMVVLMGVLADIYQPLQYLTQVDEGAITVAIETVTYKTDKEKKQNTNSDGAVIPEEELSWYISEQDGSTNSYYREMRLLSVMDKGNNEARIQKALDKHYKGDNAKADAAWNSMENIHDQLQLFGVSLLDQPWQGFVPNWLWLVALLSGLSALGSSLLSMRFAKKGQPQTDDPALKKTQGCSNGMMFTMPLFSLYITFIVPGAVGIYWIFSNLIALVQTVVLNKIYDPAKARADAQREYDERRARKLAEKKQRMAEARERQAAEEAAKKAPYKKKKPADKKPEALPEAETAEPTAEEE
ncbi:MAG: membrane protein insertase YidC [Clostridia bacterium]|nr:membrane protein insertase YidC [Clostridia bacterium]